MQAGGVASEEEPFLNPLFRLLQRIPAIRRLQDERDGLRGDQNSMHLKLRAASAEMDDLEEQCRVLQRERDQLIEAAAQRAAQIEAALLANAALVKERDALLEERRTLVAHKEAAG